MSKRRVYEIVLLAVIVTTLLGLPSAVGAQSANGITSVKDGATVSGKVAIEGNASDLNFWKWQLDLLPGGNANAAIFLATNTKAGSFSYTLDTTSYPNGDHALRLRIVRTDANYSEYVTKITVANQVAKLILATPTPTRTAIILATATTTTTAPITPTATATLMPVANGVTSVTNGAIVTGTVEIKGNASDPNFSKWQLDLLLGGDANRASFLTLDTKSGQFSYRLDTTVYPNGGHALRLRVVRSDGNYAEYVIQFTIANPEPALQSAPAPTRLPSLPSVQGQI